MLMQVFAALNNAKKIVHMWKWSSRVSLAQYQVIELAVAMTEDPGSVASNTLTIRLMLKKCCLPSMFSCYRMHSYC